MSAGDYVEGILKGDVTVLGRAVTLVESTNPAHQAVAQEVIEKCLPHAGRSIRVGISGVPVPGKYEYRRFRYPCVAGVRRQIGRVGH